MKTLYNTWLTIAPMKQFEELLPPGDFCRIHRSFIVSLKRLEAFDHERAYLVHQGLMFPISERYRRQLKARVKVITGGSRNPPATQTALPIVTTIST